jgi:hypothetical protein
MKFLKNKLEDVGAWPVLHVTQFAENWVGDDATEVFVPYDIYYDFKYNIITVEDDSFEFPYYNSKQVHIVGDTVVFENLKAFYNDRMCHGTAFKFASQMLVCEKCGELLDETDLSDAPQLPHEDLFEGAEFTDDSLLVEAAYAAVMGNFFKEGVRLSVCEYGCSRKPPTKVLPVPQKEKEFFQLHQATSQLPNLCIPTK